MVTDETRDRLRQELVEERGRLERDIANLSTTDSSAQNFLVDEQDAYDQHPADEGSELFEREKNLTLQRTLRDSLQGVIDALQRMDDGTYGTCENCGQPISEKRLQARPSAAYCIDCQSKIEKQTAATA